jgi:hypothetical protein
MEEMPWAILNQAFKTQKPSMTLWLMATIHKQVICFPKFKQEATLARKKPNLKY